MIWWVYDLPRSDRYNDPFSSTVFFGWHLIALWIDWAVYWKSLNPLQTFQQCLFINVLSAWSWIFNHHHWCHLPLQSCSYRRGLSASLIETNIRFKKCQDWKHNAWLVLSQVTGWPLDVSHHYDKLSVLLWKYIWYVKHLQDSIG